MTIQGTHSHVCHDRRFIHLRKHLQHRRDAPRLVRREPHGEIRRNRKGAGDRAGPPRHHPGGGRTGDRAQLRYRQDRHGQAAHPDGAHRLPDTGRRVADQCAVPRQARRILSLGRDHAGHHRYRHRDADTRGARPDRRRPEGHCALTGGIIAPLSRHTDDRPQQSAAGHTADLWFQDGRHPRGVPAPSRAPRTIAAARAHGRVWRCLRHARVDREGCHGDASGVDGGARAGQAGHRMAHGARHASPKSAASSAWSAARSARSRWT